MSFFEIILKEYPEGLLEIVKDEFEGGYVEEKAFLAPVAKENVKTLLEDLMQRHTTIGQKFENDILEKTINRLILWPIIQELLKNHTDGNISELAIWLMRILPYFGNNGINCCVFLNPIWWQPILTLKGWALIDVENGPELSSDSKYYIKAKYSILPDLIRKDNKLIGLDEEMIHESFLLTKSIRKRNSWMKSKLQKCFHNLLKNALMPHDLGFVWKFKARLFGFISSAFRGFNLRPEIIKDFQRIRNYIPNPTWLEY